MTVVFWIGSLVLAFAAGAWCNGHPAEVNAAGEKIRSRVGKLFDRIFNRSKQ